MAITMTLTASSPSQAAPSAPRTRRRAGSFRVTAVEIHNPSNYYIPENLLSPPLQKALQLSSSSPYAPNTSSCYRVSKIGKREFGQDPYSQGLVPSDPFVFDPFSEDVQSAPTCHGTPLTRCSSASALSHPISSSDYSFTPLRRFPSQPRNTVNSWLKCDVPGGRSAEITGSIRIHIPSRTPPSLVRDSNATAKVLANILLNRPRSARKNSQRRNAGEKVYIKSGLSQVIDVGF